jgi:hypothetical protein
MAISDDNERKKALQAQPGGARLARLGRDWFAQVREKSTREAAEFDAWNRERKKWIPGESDSDTYRPSNNFGFWADGSRNGGDGGGGD